MRCWLSAAQAAYHSFPSLPPTKTRSLRCTAFFPPKPLRWVSAGALLGAVIKTPVLYFLHFCVGVVSLPSGCCGCVGTTPRGVYFGRKTAFSEWVLCADGHAVPSCTQCFFGTSVWGGGITTLGVRFMPLKHWTRRSYGGVFAVFVPPQCSPCVGEAALVGYTRHPGPEPRTQRLTRRNTGRFHRLRHRQGR